LYVGLQERRSLNITSVMQHIAQIYSLLSQLLLVVVNLRCYLNLFLC